MPAARTAGEMPGGSETVLLVEDDDALRGVTQQMLEECGYSVLAVADGAEALRVAHAYVGPIDLLMTDVVMKEMSGPQTALRFRALRPQARILLMSGYSGTELERQGVDRDTFLFLEKPFTIDEMAARVREALDS
jgi:DNA-binding NtrC family response regulator